MRLTKIASLTFLAVLSIIVACNPEPQAPNVDHIETEFEWVRYDEKLMGLDRENFRSALNDLIHQHPSFSEIYFQRILRIPEDSAAFVQEWMESEAYIALNDSIQKYYEDMSDVKEELEGAFQYYRYYFPAEEAPNVYTACTEFSVAAFLFSDTINSDSVKNAIGLSLEFFLGDAFPYERLGLAGQTTFSSYLTRTFNRDHMSRKVLSALIEDQFSPLEGNRLIDFMIRNGAQLVILDHLLPQMSDTVLFEYTPQQLEWVKNNELQIWAHLIDKDLLYSRRMADIATLIRPAPSSAGMPPESPGQTANYIGYKIVKSYMEQTGAQLSDLTNLRDAQEVLTQSKYKAR